MLRICSENYRRWKARALSEAGDAKESLERAFFWIELHSALLALRLAEKEGKASKEAIFSAKLKICSKLLEYAEKLLKKFESS